MRTAEIGEQTLSEIQIVDNPAAARSRLRITISDFTHPGTDRLCVITEMIGERSRRAGQAQALDFHVAPPFGVSSERHASIVPKCVTESQLKRLKVIRRFIPRFVDKYFTGI